MPRGKYKRKKKAAMVFVSQKPKSAKEKRIVLTQLEFHNMMAEARKQGADDFLAEQRCRESNKPAMDPWIAVAGATSEAYVRPGPPVNAINPAHYRQHPSGVECITITEHFNFNRGNAVKYIWRADEKGSTLENLRKAQWYLNREISRLEKEATK